MQESIILTFGSACNFIKNRQKAVHYASGLRAPGAASPESDSSGSVTTGQVSEAAPGSTEKTQQDGTGLPDEAGGEPCERRLRKERGECPTKAAECFFDGGQSRDAGHIEQAEHREAESRRNEVRLRQRLAGLDPD